MDEQQINCIIGACCCEADCAEKKRKALAELLTKHLNGPYTAEKIADFMLSTFDFAPKGKLTPLMEEVARLIKAGDYQG